ncbi:Stk1 family PASTA domain-containing Ser/Thr kinase [Peribacillus muralis]|uniref:Stk1 family PASTA domain-containing Ser/Thr kinase n=1 Tax=Peribacillus muralis TaxID=264697 RepID=UPI001F4D7AD9|nr:Stk1 family PASTA domain-containing Ser/Thr kinase [Peribacillus muralis]MCK1992525.1 Stk1 family PASTA domain-containing Ser/Thr kinase [Peribacillus muralis]MCK2013081.1 Stk1 family PASTA domain-containing Ser/Thr kinase [Peribacillus muralis]
MLIGRRINGRYKLIEMVGGGGMANVYLARDMILDRDVALKILRMDFNNDEEFIKRFNREAQAATSLAHPNIVSIYDVGEEDAIYYIVMEYVDGFTLKQYIQKYYPIPVDKALDIMKQITAAISHAHHNGIIHRDIKPQNILIDKEGTVKITDFGIALALSATNITQTNAVLGSVHYLSPEQARGGMANKKSDIYSLGIVMFELLTGRLPFSGESAVSIALKHLQSETPSPKRWNPEIPQSVENIILRATAKDSYYRYESVDSMEDDIRTSLNPERSNESPFAIPEDHDATKALPVITDDQLSSVDETIIRGPEKNTVVYSDDGEDDPEAVMKVNKKQKKQKKQKKKAKQKDKKRRKMPAILVTIFLVLALLAVLSVTLGPSLLGSKEVTIPDLKGKELEDAITELLELDLVIGNTIEIDDEEVEAGLVIKTNPKEGKTVKAGAKIDIYQSGGKETISLSNYEGRDYSGIKSMLEEMGFKNTVVTYKYDASAAGTIIEQTPSGATEIVPSETELALTVSKGEDLLSLKNLKGFNQAGLNDYSNESGIKIDLEEEVYDDSVEKGLVISQSPEPGTKVEKGSTVKVVLSKGKEEIPPKIVTEEIKIEYDPVEPGKAQKVQIFIEDINNSMTEPKESFFIVEDGKRTIELTVSQDKKAGYKVMRDNQVIIDKTVSYPD